MFNWRTCSSSALGGLNLRNWFRWAPNTTIDTMSDILIYYNNFTHCYRDGPWTKLNKGHREAAMGWNPSKAPEERLTIPFSFSAVTMTVSTTDSQEHHSHRSTCNYFFCLVVSPRLPDFTTAQHCTTYTQKQKHKHKLLKIGSMYTMINGFRVHNTLLPATALPGFKVCTGIVINTWLWVDLFAEEIHLIVPILSSFWSVIS